MAEIAIANVKKLQNKIISLPLSEWLVEELEKEKEFILDLNRSQLEAGKSAEGGAIEPKYKTKRYADFKQKIGSKAPTGTPDLKVKGTFQEQFEMKLFESAVEIFSKDSNKAKVGSLEKRYGDENIYGLTIENKFLVMERIRPRLQQRAIKFLRA